MIYKAKAWEKLREELKSDISAMESNMKPELDGVLEMTKKMEETMGKMQYGFSTKRTDPEDVAQALSDFVNSSLSFESDQFAKAVVRDDRTLQQSMFRLMLKCIGEWAEFDSAQVDDRNRATVEMSKKIIAAVKDDSIPLI
jgi:uncharacterized protein YqgV (UPF0045/DUF77 family)